jgi:hypothetical protein
MKNMNSAKSLITSLGALALFGLGMSLFPPSVRAASTSSEEKIVKHLPDGAKKVEVDGKQYWLHDGIYYRRTEGGYEVMRSVKGSSPSKSETTTKSTSTTKGYDVTKDGNNPKAETTGTSTSSTSSTKDKTKKTKGESPTINSSTGTTPKSYDVTKDGTKNPKE